MRNDLIPYLYLLYSPTSQATAYLIIIFNGDNALVTNINLIVVAMPLDSFKWTLIPRIDLSFIILTLLYTYQLFPPAPSGYGPDPQLLQRRSINTRSRLIMTLGNQILMEEDDTPIRFIL